MKYLLIGIIVYFFIQLFEYEKQKIYKRETLKILGIVSNFYCLCIVFVSPVLKKPKNVVIFNYNEILQCDLT